jgi:hypothetical protein
MRKQLLTLRSPLDVPMPMQQTLVAEDLSAMRLLTVPDVWPPIDSPILAAVAGQRAAAAAFTERAGNQPGERASDQAQQRSGDQADGHAWPRQFAVLLAEALTGARPERQILPWLSQRGTVHLYRLLPRFAGGQGARVQRILTTQPSPDVIEMTVIVAVGPRTRALAVRLAWTEPAPRPQWRATLPTHTAESRSAASPRWLCTDIEAA